MYLPRGTGLLRGEWISEKITIDKILSASWCAAIIDQVNLSLQVALPTRVNQVKRQFASKDLVDG